MAQASAAKDGRQRGRQQAPGHRHLISPVERHKYHLIAFAATFLLINPLFLYRIPGVAEHLYLDQWFGFASFWQHNDIGSSLIEVMVWLIAYLPFYEHVPFTNMSFEIIPKIIVGLAIGALMIIAFIKVKRKFWIAFKNYNESWALTMAIKNTAMFGAPVAIVMLALNYWGGIPFTTWNIVEVSLWVGLFVLANVIAEGMLWLFDLRYEGGSVGTNQTMSDHPEVDYGHEHVDDSGHEGRDN